MVHIPVLTKEVLEYLEPKRGENFIDCTFGQGGHTHNILERIGPNGKLLGIETDPELYKIFQTKEDFQFADRLTLVNDSYTNLKEIVKEYKFGPINGILVDLGLSSWHFEESGRGFSFKKDEPLDMRYDPEHNPLTAFEIVNAWPEEELERILKQYGEERFAKNIAKKIVRQREIKPIRTTFDLLEATWRGLPPWFKKKKLHPATKTFQAIRTAVNSEIENLKIVLVQATEVLAKDGRLAIISFHSLEDREVKRFFKRGQEINILKVLTKKPIVPTEEEIKINIRSRSAKLRVAQKIV
jgi:16S rRNA (cytosine1402-N4)-methyltransferase